MKQPGCRAKGQPCDDQTTFRWRNASPMSAYTYSTPDQTRVQNRIRNVWCVCAGSSRETTRQHGYQRKRNKRRHQNGQSHHHGEFVKQETDHPGMKKMGINTAINEVEMEMMVNPPLETP